MVNTELLIGSLAFIVGLLVIQTAFDMAQVNFMLPFYFGIVLSTLGIVQVLRKLKVVK